MDVEFCTLSDDESPLTFFGVGVGNDLMLLLSVSDIVENLLLLAFAVIIVALINSTATMASDENATTDFLLFLLYLFFNIIFPFKFWF